MTYEEAEKLVPTSIISKSLLIIAKILEQDMDEYAMESSAIRQAERRLNEQEIEIIKLRKVCLAKLYTKK